MTNDQLLDLLSFEENLQSVTINSEKELNDNATFIVATLHFNDGLDVAETEMTVPFVHYAGQDWIFTPWDWQGWLPETPEDVDRIEWCVDDSDVQALMFNGLPMLAPWVPDPHDFNRETRKRIGSQLKAERERQGISIRSLAEKTGVDKNIISRIEAGRANATIDTLNALAMYLGLTVNLDR